MKNEIVEVLKSCNQYEDMSRMVNVAATEDLDRVMKVRKEIDEVFDDHLNNGVINEDERASLKTGLGIFELGFLLRDI